jgi:hypothetical protein
LIAVEVELVIGLVRGAATAVLVAWDAAGDPVTMFFGTAPATPPVDCRSWTLAHDPQFYPGCSDEPGLAATITAVGELCGCRRPWFGPRQPGGCCCGECPEPVEPGERYCACCDEELERPAEIDVDLGSGGWTDVDCGRCDEVAGVFTLRAVRGGCLWEHVEDWCVNPEAGCPPWRLWIQLVLVPEDGLSCTWRLAVWLGRQAMSVGGTTVGGASDDTMNFSCAGGAEAYYASDPVATPIDCTSAVTLTKLVGWGYFGEHDGLAGQTPCAGSLVGTITATPVAVP